jgi:formylmethanofuran dehydrogenase subunit E
MKGEEVAAREDFKRCLAFHGHLCPGLSIGYRAARAALRALKEKRAQDEELVAIVETDACGSDAIQVLTGCTFGKGNFIHRDHGKQVLTLLGRESGKGVRVALKADAFSRSEKHTELIEKIRSEEATEEERREFRSLHEQRSYDILARPVEEIFTVREVEMQLPPKARIVSSSPCSRCGEMTMVTKLLEQGGKKICKDCAQS